MASLGHNELKHFPNNVTLVNVIILKYLSKFINQYKPYKHVLIIAESNVQAIHSEHMSQMLVVGNPCNASNKPHQ